MFLRSSCYSFSEYEYDDEDEDDWNTVPCSLTSDFCSLTSALKEKNMLKRTICSAVVLLVYIACSLCAQDAEKILEEGERHHRHLEGIYGDSLEIVLADRRYGYISGACTEALVRTVEHRHDLSDLIDRVVTHPILGLPIFVGMMYLLFQLTFWVGNPLVDLIDSGLHEKLLPALDEAWQTDSLFKGLVLDGVIVCACIID